MGANCDRMFVLFLGYVLFLLPTPSASQSQDAMQLLRFRNSLPESSRSLLPWNQTTSLSAHCNWRGVSCNSETDFGVKSLNLSTFYLSGILEDSFSNLCQLPDLTSLDLSWNNFTGKVPADLGNCSVLIYIFLYNNSLSGPIPPGIFTPGRIQYLDLGLNLLSGTIPPEVGQCRSLAHLRLDDNILNGEIPSELFSLQYMTNLSLSRNVLNGSIPDLPLLCSLGELKISGNSFHGPLPSSISNCHDLRLLDVSHNNLEGTLPQNIFQSLPRLEELYLNVNNFEGQLPLSLWTLRNLTELALSHNKFNGSIPEDIGRCDRLTYIDLSNNSFTGHIPTSVSHLRNLETFILERNMLSGSIPPGIGNCSALVDFIIGRNQISGILPPEICGLQSLQRLRAANNFIEGPIPSCIGNLVSLDVVELHNNSLTGGIPSGVSKLTKLRNLTLAQNDLTGEVPLDLGKNNVPGFIIVDLTGNNLTGKIPTTLCSGNNLQRLTLGDNQFIGGFPTEITKCKPLQRLFLYNNSLEGSIPNDIGNTSSISQFKIHGNFFEGAIPSVFGSWSNLSLVDLSGNKFSGPIPPEFGMLQELEELRISSNKLTGGIPAELSRCPRISKLDLSQNELAGGVPSEIISSPTLTIIRLQDNKLSGVIPDKFVSSQPLTELQLGNNLLTGPFPCSLSTVKNFMTLLNISVNQFSGEIPNCIRHLAKLGNLDISNNSFSGKIPSETNEMISLLALNISNNQLSGHVPAVWAKALEPHPETYSGNPRLCPVSNKTSSCGTHKKAHPGILAGIVTGSLFLTACLLAAVYKLVNRFWRRTPSSPEQEMLYHRSSNEELPEDLTFLDILRGTEGWSDKHVIGRGKHGIVYRAQSVKSKKHWAIKKVDLNVTNFNTEMSILNVVRHRNILRMGGYSIRNGYGYIVTEYMPEGTLYNLLHQRRPPVALDWEQRYCIALGIAQGLSYLHHDCVPQIIHRDIKSDNILLDCEFEPRIADFGAAIMESDDDENQAASLIIGTLGYMAPENAYSTKLTDKCDVYSYGVTLMELLCRKLPVDPSFDEGLDIVSWVRNNVHGNEDFFSCLDEQIQYWEKEDQQEAVAMMDLALQCTEMVPDIRPSMRNVVSSLLKFRQKPEVNSRSHSIP